MKLSKHGNAALGLVLLSALCLLALPAPAQIEQAQARIDGLT